ncbi:peptidase M4 family protein [Tersicoccus phoenicis]|uniref:Neutral metalloproteinase n=1 Tax=Tersicoccus phoenicis TaxID=554083 RepID=A0A1R1LJB1_9MICC|nr:M4 family metallopeptidase [Tersicoccus phoenicis]OMH27621.1 peptidase M4 family protein [Tersicoccus phoenicis]
MTTPTHCPTAEQHRGPFCTIVPPYLLQRLAGMQEPPLLDAAGAARHALDQLERIHAQRRGLRGSVPPPVTRTGLTRTISDAGNSETLPGATVRTEGQPPVADAAVDQAYDGLGTTYDFYAAAYGRRSLDGDDLPLDATVHFGQGYDNAFWNGERMVFGDGDGEVFVSFTSALTVIAHELTHGVMQYSANLVYQDQSGALNESVSDVFGVLTEQWIRRQDAASADWLVGAGVFGPRVRGVALRSLKAPGTAFDDPTLGKDPQPAHMDGYVDTTEDSGGVHLNSGIPNHAFYLTATALGGNAWDRAGRIWYDTITSDRLPASADFARFAQETLDVAAARFGADGAEVSAVTDAWQGVGVTPGKSARTAEGPVPG